MFKKFSIVVGVTIFLGVLIACASVYFVNGMNREVYMDAYYQNIESELNEYFAALQEALIEKNQAIAYMRSPLMREKVATIDQSSSTVWLSDYKAYMSVVKIGDDYNLFFQSKTIGLSEDLIGNNELTNDFYNFIPINIEEIAQIIKLANSDLDETKVSVSIEKVSFKNTDMDHLKNINSSVVDILGTNYYVVMTLTDSMIERIFFYQRNSIIYTIIIAGVSVGVTILLFVGYLESRVGQATKVIKRISEGEYALHLKGYSEKSNDELSQLAMSINKMSEDIKSHQLKIENNYLEMVDVIINAVESNDFYTSKHNIAVGDYAEILADEIHYKKIDDIILAAKLHDIGKISIPSSIINKTGKLTEEEFELVKKHPVEGYRIIEKIEYFDDIKLGVKYHHERYDGSGYPEGLVGDEIPLMAQIIAIADVYDAITSNRSYRNAMSSAEAETLIINQSGKHFNPLLVEAFKRRKEDFKLRYDQNNYRR